MDYKEKYEMALEGIQEILSSGEDSIKMSRLQLRLQGIFPELKENEDERMRKHIIEILKDNFSGEDTNKCIAWLEKQGNNINCIYDKELSELLHIVICRYINDPNISYPERENVSKKILPYVELLEKQGEHKKFIDSIQIGDKVTRNEDGMLVNLSQLKRVAKPAEKQGKQMDNLTQQEAMDIAVAKCFNEGEQKPADKVKPKFHKDDWIVHQGTENIYQVVACVDNHYELKYGDNYTVQKCADVDRCARLWDITKDAKPGDVLACNEEILLFKSYSVQGRISLYCWYNGQTNNFHSKEVVDALMTTRNKICPATKEQSDTLIKAMNNAGYIFDFGTKELKKLI